MKTSMLLFLALTFAAGIVDRMSGQQTEAQSDYPERGMVPNKRMLHIGIVVHDIEKSLDQWVAFLGLETRPEIFVAAGHEANPTRYRGHPSNAQAKLVFLNLDNLQVELIEPMGDEPSHWKDFLDTKGEGIHHIAFEVKGMGEQYLENYAKNGFATAQHGGWDTGEYGYLDTVKALGVAVELIENYSR